MFAISVRFHIEVLLARVDSQLDQTFFDTGGCDASGLTDSFLWLGIYDVCRCFLICNSITLLLA